MKLDVDHLARLLGPWSEGPGPLSKRLAERLAALIDDGSIADAVILPTERTVAVRLGVSRTTATAAYRILKDADRIDSRQGSGSWVRRPAGTPPGSRGVNSMFRNLGQVPADMVDLALGETRVGAATSAALADLPRDWLDADLARTGYHPAGVPELRDDLARWHSERGLPAEPDGIVVTTGAQQAISLAATCWCAPGATVLTDEATFPGALEVFRRLDARVLGIPSDSQGPDPDALYELGRRHRPALAYLIPVGSNPTGVTTSPRRLDALADSLRRLRLPVIDDRTPAPLLRDGRPPAHLATLLPPDQVVTVGSTSKIAWAGLRTGWAVTSRTLARDLIDARLAADLAGSVPGQLLLRHLVPKLDDLAAAARASLDTSLTAIVDALTTHLPSWRFDVPRAAAWVWVELPVGDAVAFADQAERHGVLVTPGPVFSPDAHLHRRLRLTALGEPATVVEGVRRLAAAWTVYARQPTSPRPATRLVI